MKDSEIRFIISYAAFKNWNFVAYQYINSFLFFLSLLRLSNSQSNKMIKIMI